ncbi:MAG: Ribonuclease 3 [Candidatus Woesebacteria bacterium GW2011_GWA1_39_21]|uniref:Ribonuclease 3 n=1 Tax=Candidatus Woesebacteria bacterium GW2011_GWA1_39_21 TaxID=1618550 RepID=A0A0G0QNQ5_9BACT|nr:MAG: Ribonuclease 3 [Candidatus Woesebacteria bacterium GW2011_GWA1_39_21]
MKSFNELKKSFKDAKLLNTALTHRSWVNEHKNQNRSNERLEFLGDAILEYVVSDLIYVQFPEKEEGFLTALRARIVNTESLSEASEKFALGKFLLLSKGEEDTGGRSNHSLLADTLEAVIGAVYLDQGLVSCKNFIKEKIIPNLEEISKEPLKDPKSLFQEYVQAKGLSTPKYQVIKEVGPDHDKTFTLDVTVDGNTMGTGTGKSKSEAAQNAAKDALEKNL